MQISKKLVAGVFLSSIVLVGCSHTTSQDSNQGGNDQAAQQAAPTPEDKTKDFVTYDKNEKYSFKHPQDWTLDDSGSSLVLTSPEMTEAKNTMKSAQPDMKTIPGVLMTVAIQPKNGTSLEEGIKKAQGSFDDGQFDLEKTTIDGKTAYAGTIIPNEKSGFGGSSARAYFVDDGKDSIYMVMALGFSEDAMNKHEDTVDLIARSITIK